MIKSLFLLSAGIFSHSLLPVLPGAGGFYVLACMGAALLIPGKRWRLAGFLLVGVAYGGIWANQQMAHRLPVEMDKSDITVIGEIASLTGGDDNRTVFTLDVVEIIAAGRTGIPDLQKLRISWYGENDVQPGERWQLRVRVRSPRGYSNPGAFDYSAWLLAQGISATGYVRQNPVNRRMAPAADYSLHNLRFRLLGSLLERVNADDDVAGVMAALILGEQGLIPSDRFHQLKLTGTVHLVVVSGLHIGMVSGLGFLIGLGWGRLAVALGATIPARILAVPAALSAAAGYGLLAGFDLPVQRALIMTTAALVALSARRTVHVWRAFALALSLIAMIDPMAVMSAGFWLSFMAVAGLLFWFSYRPPLPRGRQLLATQVVVFVSLAPWLIYFQGNTSLWALPVNLLAIPWVSLSIVPCCLLGVIFRFLPSLGDGFWRLAEFQTGYLLRIFSWIEANSEIAGLSPLVNLPSAHPEILAVLFLVAVLLLLPRGLGARVPVLILLVGLIVMRRPTGGALELAVLDVGQGLAIAVRSGEKVLVYDAGPGFPSGFNTGEAVVVPYLNSLGITAVDRVIVSHGDNDHAGGLRGLQDFKQIRQLLSGQPARISRADADHCDDSVAWQWGDVGFRVLWPPAGGEATALREDNNTSCVLLIEKGDTRILLPGDIEAEVERELLRRYGRQELDNLSVLVAPHHGSKTSSSAVFVSTVAPQHVVFSAGFNHHFGHPHPDVVARYEAAGVRIWETGEAGAIVFRWENPPQPSISSHRAGSRRYWR